MKTIPAFLIGIAAAALGAGAAGAAAHDPYSNYLELRVYRAQEGQRDSFLAYFEDNLLETQEAHPMRIWGEFRDVQNEHQFVWMRGYRTMGERLESLQGFYFGPVWAEKGPEVMQSLFDGRVIAYLLEPMREGSGFSALPGREPAGGERGVIGVEIYVLEGGERDAVVEHLHSVALAHHEKCGGVTLGLFETSDEQNNFPMLQHNEDQHVIVWVGSYASAEAFDRASAGAGGIEPDTRLTLEPGPRSRLSHRE